MNCSTKYSSAVADYLDRTGYSHIEPRAALIDMDGTLYDSMRNHAASWYRLTTELGMHTTYDEFFLYEGRTGASTLTLLFNREYGHDPTPEEIAELYHRKTVLFTEMPPVDPMAGAKEMLDFLAAYDIRRVLVTGSGQSSLINRLSTDFPGAFADADRITSRDVIHGKPHPEPYLKAMELASVEPWQSIVFENAPLGVEAGAASGAFTIGLTTGPIPAATLKDAGADIVFDSMKQCADSLPQLFQLFN